MSLDHCDGLQALVVELSAAEDALSRLDGRLRGNPLLAGWTTRTGFTEAAAWAWASGELAPMEDLVLHDAMTDVAPPGSGVLTAHAAVRARRKAARADPKDLLSWDGAASLAGRRPGRIGLTSEATAALQALQLGPRDADVGPAKFETTPPPLPFLSEMTLPRELETEDPEALFEIWAGARTRLAGCWPSLVVAVVLIDLWEQLEPFPRQGHLGPVLAQAHLREAGRLKDAGLLVRTGARALASSGRRLPDRPTIARAAWWLAAIGRGAQAGLAELDRLTLARQVLDRHLRDRRESSRLPALVDLFLRSPVVSAPLAAQELGLSQQAARTMIASLGASVHEVTGRRRYRAWRI